MASDKKIVAVAGGSSPGLGTNIVGALAQSATFKPIILSRAKPDTHPSGSVSTAPETGIETRYVDYLSLDSLTSALAGVHTLISVTLARNQLELWATIETNLLTAARQAGVKRFAPSEFVMGPLSHEKLVPIFQPKLLWWDACKKAAAEARAKGEQFEVARFHTGYFMNYLGPGAPYEKEAALGGRSEDDPSLYFHFRDNTIEIPETPEGKIPRISLTTLEDIGRFVRAAVELSEGEWEEEMGIVGDSPRFDEIAADFEAVTGRTLKVDRIKPEEYERRLQKAKEETDFYGMLGAMFKLCHGLDQDGVGVIEPTVNRKCPHIKPTTVKEYLERFWGGKKA